MNELRKLLVGIFGLSLAILFSVLILMKGWGLEPKSWAWIIGGTLTGRLIAEFIILIAKSDDK